MVIGLTCRLYSQSLPWAYSECSVHGQQGFWPLSGDMYDILTHYEREDEL